jgi:hypothetical protein
MMKKLKEWLSDFRVIFAGWLIMALIPWLSRWLRDVFDLDYSIFYHSFWHAWQQMPLYIIYPEDGNYFLYGPLFTVLMAPLAVLPYQLGRLLWMLIITVVPFWSIRKTCFTRYQQVFILWFVAAEAYLCTLDSESNSLILAILIFSFYLIDKEEDRWAALLIALGTTTKLFGIVGLAFLPFSHHKLKLIGWTAAWTAILLVLPMLVFGVDYISQQYMAWYDVLVHKNELNQFAAGQNVSLLGIVRKVSGCATYSDLWLMIPGMVLFALPYLRFKQYQHAAFRQTILASVLMFIILFATSSENYGYIIAMTGVAIWYTAAPWKRSKWDVALMVLAFIFTSMSSSDLFYKPLWREVIKPYSLKALPVTIIWLKLTYELCKRDYEDCNDTHPVL